MYMCLAIYWLMESLVYIWCEKAIIKQIQFYCTSWGKKIPTNNWRITKTVCFIALFKEVICNGITCSIILKNLIGIVEIGRGGCIVRSGSCLGEGYQSLSRMFVLLGRCQKQLTAGIHLTIKKGVVYGSKSY